MFKRDGYFTRRKRQTRLKAAIRHRLATEDYTCRLPKPPKPRVRYKLTKYWYKRSYNAPYTLVWS